MRRVYLAEDDESDRALFAEALEKISNGISLSTAANGDDLIVLLRDSPPASPHDLVFLDLNMPGKNGIETLVELRRNLSYRRLPIIIFSTSDDQGIINELFEKGADYYITKPSSLKQFEKLIYKALTVSFLIKRERSRESFMIKASDSLTRA